MKTVTVSQMKKIEKQSDICGVSYDVLMKNAGTMLGKFIEKIIDDYKNKKIIFLCGNGNNGGDCFVAAEYLRNIDYNVSVALLCGIPRTEISQNAFSCMNQIAVYTETEDIKSAVSVADVIVDGVFGTGFHGELDDFIKNIFSLNSNAIKIAADIPSGGNATNGAVSEGTFKADYTVTFGFLKFGMTQYPLKSFCKNIQIVDIGIPSECKNTIPEINYLSDISLSSILRKRVPDSHKGTYGTLLCVTGSRNMPGAAMLSSKAALRCGCGLLKQCSVSENIPSLAAYLPEAVYVSMNADENGSYLSENIEKLLNISEKASAILIGCGLSVTKNTKTLVAELIRSVKCPVILDADGINCISEDTDVINEAKNGIILTPHPAEAARLMKCTVREIQSDRYGISRAFAEKFPDSVLVLKGAGTVITSKDKMYVNNTGNSGMSKGGSGDILSGMIASFAAQGISLEKSAVLGVYIHGEAGDRAAEKYSMHSMLPGDIINEFYEIFLETESYIK